MTTIAALAIAGLDRLRGHAVLADLDIVLMTSSARLARNDVHGCC
jgi:hypothetical protein